MEITMSDPSIPQPAPEPSHPTTSVSRWATPPTSLDWHIWMHCNLSCKFCFKTFSGFLYQKPPQSSLALGRPAARKVLVLLRAAGFEKVTFAGGEPTMHPFLPEILDWSHELGMTVMLVTNGHFLTDTYVRRIASSVDAVKDSRPFRRFFRMTSSKPGS